jgi:mRNA interferase RelE/StbE
MYSLLVAERVVKFLGDPKRFPAKVYRQLAAKIFLLQFEPRPHDSKKVGSGYRVDVGEYRILYTVDDKERTVAVELLGPRNDDEIYKLARRLGLI